MNLKDLLVSAALACSTLLTANAASWQFNAAASDEFDGTTINAAKWYTYHDEYRADIFKSSKAIMYNDYVRPMGAANYIRILCSDQKWDSPKYTTSDFRVGGIRSVGAFGPNTSLRAKVKIVNSPVGNSFSFWLANQTVWPPEIDIFEMPKGLFPNEDKFKSTVHYGQSYTHKGSQPFDKTETKAKLQGWNNYRVDWTPAAVVFYFNDIEYKRIAKGPANIRDTKGTDTLADDEITVWPDVVPSKSMNVIINAAVCNQASHASWFGIAQANGTTSAHTWLGEMQVASFQVYNYK